MNASEPDAALSAEPLWQLEHVWLQGGQPRLKDVTAAILPGVTAILGASGAGKTSLLNLLVQFEYPSRGQVVPIGVQRRRLSVSWVPQSYSLWPHLTVAQHLRVVMPESSRDRPHSLQSILERWHLEEHAQRSPQQLSAGLQARLSVARALASEAKVLVMDEPLSHLAPAHVPHYQTLIGEHLQETGCSFIFASHNRESVFQWATQVIGLSHGSLVYQGRLADLYGQPASQHEAELLGPVNWFTPEDYCRWFDEPAPARSQGVWPEQLEVEHVRESHLRVESCEFLGAYATWKLRHVARGELRVLRGCPPTLLPVGSCVRLRTRSVVHQPLRSSSID